MKGPVTQEWTHGISFMQQTVLLTAVRGPDNTPKYTPTKYLLRWYRRCILVSSLDGIVLDNPYDPRGGSFMGPSYTKDAKYTEPHVWATPMEQIVSEYLRELDALPHHWHMHFMHAAQIVAHKHPNRTIGNFWGETYLRFVRDMHLLPEPESEMDRRLGDDKSAWLASNDKATVD